MGSLELAQRAWDKAFEALRKAEKDAGDVLLALGEMVRWSEVEQGNAACLQALNQSLRSIFVRVATKVPVPPDLFILLDRATQEELDRIFVDLDKRDYHPPSPGGDFQLAA